MKIFDFWNSKLVLKMLALTPLTARQRFRKQLFVNVLDENVKTSAPKTKVVYDNPNVKRVRKRRRSDMENIVILFIMTFIWLCTRPLEGLTVLYMRTFVPVQICAYLRERDYAPTTHESPSVSRWIPHSRLRGTYLIVIFSIILYYYVVNDYLLKV